MLQDDSARVPQLAIFTLNNLEFSRLLVLHDIAVANRLLVRPELNAFFHLQVLVKCYFVVFSSDLLYQVLVCCVDRVLPHVV